MRRLVRAVPRMPVPAASAGAGATAVVAAHRMAPVLARALTTTAPALDKAMFCFQCEQTEGGKGCTVVGVCGKKPEVRACACFGASGGDMCGYHLPQTPSLPRGKRRTALILAATVRPQCRGGQWGARTAVMAADLRGSPPARAHITPHVTSHATFTPSHRCRSHICKMPSCTP